MKKKLTISLIIISLFFGGMMLTPKADSGWDSSYDSSWDSRWDSSSSWDNDSGWDSSSSWDRDYSSSSSYHGSSSSSGSLVSLIIFIVIIIIVFNVLRSTGKPSSSPINMYQDLDDEILKKYGINKSEFKKMVYDKYVSIQKDWMNFNYKGLQSNLTDELYNTYKMQLEALKLKKQKNIMDDFNLIDCRIISVNEINGLLNVNAFLRVEMHDYVVDEKEEVVRGNKNALIDIEYVITFVKSSSSDDKEVMCPNCGAKIDAVARGKCEYCGSTVVVNAKDFVMSKKTCVGQRNK